MLKSRLMFVLDYPLSILLCWTSFQSPELNHGLGSQIYVFHKFLCHSQQPAYSCTVTHSWFIITLDFQYADVITERRYMRARCMLRPCVCLSVCPSVTNRNSMKMAKPFVTHITLRCSLGAPFFRCQLAKALF